MLQKLLCTEFPAQGSGCTVKPTRIEHKFMVMNNGSRVCPFGPTHDSNNGVFYVHGKRVVFYCLSERCKSQEGKTFYVGELSPQNERTLNCITAAEIGRETNLTSAVFRRIDEVYATELATMNIVHFSGEKFEEVHELCVRWRHDIHAAINQFTVRILDGSCHSVMFTQEYGKYGQIFRKPKKMKQDQLKAMFSDVDIYLPSAEPVKEKKSRKRKRNATEETQEETEKQMYVLVRNAHNLGKYLTSNKPGEHMSQGLKVSYKGIEMYPALPEDDTRDPDEVKRQNKLNLFMGFQVTTKMVEEFRNQLNTKPELKARYEHDLGLLLDHHLHALAMGNEEVHSFLLKYMAFIWRKPWEKLDFHPNLYGAGAVGKSLFYSKLLHELFGPDYSIIISKVEHLDPSFNANVITKMFMTLEEIAGANRHNLGTFLKGLFDRTQKKTHKQKHFEDTEIDTYFKAVFITNEQFVHLTSKEERRWWFWRVEDNGWINEQWKRTGPYSEGKGECFGSRADYFSYLADINPFFCKSSAES